MPPKKKFKLGRLKKTRNAHKQKPHIIEPITGKFYANFTNINPDNPICICVMGKYSFRPAVRLEPTIYPRVDYTNSLHIF